MSKVRFYRYTLAELNKQAKIDGRLYFTTDTNDIYMDVNSNRYLMSSKYSLSVNGTNIVLKDQHGNQTTVPGSTGPVGPTGATGSVGPTGATGATGPTGSDLSVLKAYPVGSIYTSISSTNPASLFGGTWSQITDKFLYATTSNIGSTGGSNDAIVVSHSHSASSGSAGSHTHNVSASSAGAHTHTVSASSAGAHTHSASSGAAGAHGHSLLLAYTSDSGSQEIVTTSLNPFSFTTASQKYWGGGKRMQSASNHTHSVSVASAGAHTHSGTAASAGAHTHSGTAASAGAHSHSVTVNSTGSSASGANMPAYYRVYAWRRTA